MFGLNFYLMISILFVIIDRRNFSYADEATARRSTGPIEHPLGIFDVLKQSDLPSEVRSLQEKDTK